MDKRIKEDWQGRRAAVIGLGISNFALIKFLKDAGAEISARDQKTREELGERLEELKSLGVELVLGPDYLDGLDQYDVVLPSPGVPKHLPPLAEAASRGKLESEISLLFRYSPSPIYGITGSSGKTTTTSLAWEIMKASGLKAIIGGNIGTPLITELPRLTPEHKIVLELSSFQLENLEASPQGALITNIAENHLDVHGTMESYIAAKQNIYRYQKPQDFLVLNYDDPESKAMAVEAPGKVFFFSMENRVECGAYLRGDDLVYVQDGREEIIVKREELLLRGEHNAANFLAAAVLSCAAGASVEAAAQVARSFQGVPHRLEFVGERNGVLYYNDSIATTPQRTLAALKALSEPIILIAGGYDKQLSFAPLAEAVHKRVKHLVLLGAAAPKIRQAVLALGDFPLQVVDNLDQAVAAARLEAQPGDCILLSPACASYDQYADFTERGAHFRSLVQS
ncbi:MAG TPA: UDP-N-acetylmuramoyl-L-alanine--D-glutamate ligase [Firmicutes bacterium]|nr:UDP-N-acetylmuramoyl-L-alanine--D-glutamate ligase [Bacillota bacterium]